jgi:hypothetical protein
VASAPLSVAGTPSAVCNLLISVAVNMLCFANINMFHNGLSGIVSLLHNFNFIA